LKLLGIRFAETGPKASDFAEDLKTLVLVVDLAESDAGGFKLGHFTADWFGLALTLLEGN